MISRELIAASTEPLVLSLLQRGESYGYAIAEKVRAFSKGKMEWTEGMLYPVLASHGAARTVEIALGGDQPRT